MKLSRWIPLPALLVCCLAASSCGGNEARGSQAAGATTQPVPQVEVTAVKSQKLNATVPLPAELSPYEAVDLYAKETGFLKSIAVDRGSTVKQGQVIAELEAPELLARRSQAEAAYG